MVGGAIEELGYQVEAKRFDEMGNMAIEPMCTPPELNNLDHHANQTVLVRHRVTMGRKASVKEVGKNLRLSRAEAMTIGLSSKVYGK